MNENTNRNVLAELEAFEAAGFRVGQLARRLRAEHPGLSVMTMEPTVWVIAGHAGPDVHAELEIQSVSVDSVRAWATALDVEATVTTSATSPYERAEALAVIGDVTVKVTGSRSLTGDEYNAWRAQQKHATNDEAKAVEAGDA
ncbi:hypothetical protein IHE56_15295 [Streptomyces sp. ID01-12c]|uniref:hypothetical protein n=1 Tax=Streptomyces caniscabiei TaxID=2746961 RepID=UPI0017827E79|nr:hypothetical protein [Streptomyces caniscabiei]MBD9703423.1 hypothetical protein [Streptomyces caniscabiei]MDX3726914.1 hypothetical protein [Streptomyces caniscabiei]